MASWANIASDLSGSLNNIMENTMVTRAVLVFPKERPDQVSREEVKAAKRPNIVPAVEAVNDIQKGLSKVSEAVSKVSKAVPLSELSSHLDQLGTLEKSFQVPFNPSNLQIRSVGGGRFAITDYGTEEENDTSMERTQMKPHIVISFKIIVDDTNNADAFMFDKFSLSPSGTVQNLGTLAARAGGKKEFSVRSQVEGFLSVVRDSYRRMVILQWGKLRYTGILNSVQARYTMFSTSGNPIRAEIDVSIQSAGKDNESMLGFWRGRYTSILDQLSKKQDDGTVTGAAGNLSNAFSNLLNL